MSSSRRQFVFGMAASGLAATRLRAQTKASASCPFKLAVINDEISNDFDHACFIAANEFGLEFIELRGMWGKNVTVLSDDQIAESKRILAKYSLKVTDIASPLFKSDFPGAPLSKFGSGIKHPEKVVDPKEQDVLLEKCIDLAKAFGTDRIRCFDFWRLEDPKPFRKAIDATLSEASKICAKHNLILLMENEPSCNTGTGEEAADTLAGVPDKNFMLNWDPGNAGRFPGNIPYPNAYKLLPKHRIGHVHCKDVQMLPNGKSDWAPVGAGVLDWVGQFQALVRDGFHQALSLETHWHGGGTPEESTRISMKGLKATLVKAGITC